MNTRSFSSADFGETTAEFVVQMPDKLAHIGVENGYTNQKFSEERKHPVHFIDLPSNSISMTIGGLIPSGRTNTHRHTYETIVYILSGKGYSVIQDKKVEWQAGDAIYIPNWAWHHHVNLDQENPAKYLACENAPMLQNLGQLAIREER